MEKELLSVLNKNLQHQKKITIVACHHETILGVDIQFHSDPKKELFEIFKFQHFYRWKVILVRIDNNFEYTLEKIKSIIYTIDHYSIVDVN